MGKKILDFFPEMVYNTIVGGSWGLPKKTEESMMNLVPQFDELRVLGWLRNRLRCMGVPDESEAEGILHEAYMLACRDFDPDFSTTFATYFVHKALGLARDYLKRQKVTLEYNDELDGRAVEFFSQVEFLDGLCGAAEFLARLILEWPEELEQEISPYPAPHPTVSSIRAAARRLARAAGFRQNEIQEGFSMVRERLFE